MTVSGLSTPVPAGQARAHGAMLVYAFLVSTSFPVGAAITRDLDPVVLTCLRFALAALAFAAVVSAAGEWRRPSLGGLLRYAAISLTMVGFFVLMFEALRWTDPLSAGALFTLTPLMTAVIGYLAVRQRCSLWQIACLIFGASAAAWVVFDGRLERLLAFDLGYGELLFLGGALCFAAYPPAVKRLHRGESLLLLTFWVLFSGALLLAAYGAPRIAATDWAAVPRGVFLGIAYLAVFNTAVTFIIAKYASLRLQAFKVMAYTYLTPAFVVLLEGALGHGWPSASVIAGIAATAAVTLLLQRTSDG
ncbi:MAG: DMT family transporter [Kiloniellales bacterium]|nr:DMT family transporter [Kiloniellales bacterium]